MLLLTAYLCAVVGRLRSAVTIILQVLRFDAARIASSVVWNIGFRLDQPWHLLLRLRQLPSGAFPQCCRAGLYRLQTLSQIVSAPDIASLFFSLEPCEFIVVQAMFEDYQYEEQEW